MSNDKNLIVEGHKPGTRFRVGLMGWANGSPCPESVVQKLREEGYTLRTATTPEIFVDDMVQCIVPLRTLRPLDDDALGDD
jgi:hypothetical protein